MTVNSVIRKMTAADIDAVWAIDRACFSDTVDLRSYRIRLRKPAWHQIVLECDGEIVGFARSHLVGDVLIISKMAILPAYRGKGLSRGLLSTLIADGVLRGAKTSSLKLRTDNYVAAVLYLNAGFRCIDIIPGYYTDDGSAAVCFSMPIR